MGVIFVLFRISLSISGNPMLQITTKERRVNLLGSQLSPNVPYYSAIP